MFLHLEEAEQLLSSPRCTAASASKNKYGRAMTFNLQPALPSEITNYVV